MRDPVHLYFFRGLSTYGQDNARWSIFDFGPMYANFAREFKKREIIFHPVVGMGAGTLNEVSARAVDFLRKDPVWNSPAPVHFMGHSAGGLVARMVAAAMAADPSVPNGKIKSVLTLASPNRGSGMARVCIDMPRTHRGSNLLLRAFGYDISSKAKFFEELTSGNIEKTFSAPAYTTMPASFRAASIVCASPRREWCLPLRLFYLVRAFGDFVEESDGVVEKSSQPYGEVLAELKIDHFRQIGIFRKGRMFDELCDIAAQFFKESNVPRVI